MHILECGPDQLDLVAPLFDAYRVFYDQPSDPAAARDFLRANLEGRRSRVFMLTDEGRAVAFAQLYPTYCSIALRPFFYLSDLFCDPAARRKGHARTLMRHLIEVFGQLDVHRLTLETAITNHAAQRLYESLGYERDGVFLTYHRLL
ncbi:GNAT family N-acetyltransferase [Derxia gummosa]|uniref:GNAT family N-acetyltransferase n=1 Tax=Derxia gummosa DSM 723 TaxID=1121388 RepID=A0A8B6X119_9BURK|nr:GNAT family N-acetyltransferase [Derxia gummosa]